MADVAEKLKPHLTTEGLFRVPGSAVRMRAMEAAANRGESIEGAPSDLAGTLKAFLRELPDPLMTQRLYPAFVQAWQVSEPEQRVKAILLLCVQLPPAHLHTLIFLMGLLSDVVKSSGNLMSANNLSAVFTPNILRPNDEDRKTRTRASTTTEVELRNHSACVGVIELLILHHSEIGVITSDITGPAESLDPVKAQRDFERATVESRKWWYVGLTVPA